MATAHAFRRACCTRQYTRSGEDTDTIYRYMGHADKTLAWAPSGPFGLTDDELRKMCLRQYVSCTPFHPGLPLRYAVDGEIHTSKVPACQINLVIPAGFDFTLLVKNTEPGNVTRISGDDLLIQEECWGMCPASPYTYSLLASDELLSVCDEGPLIPDD